MSKVEHDHNSVITSKMISLQAVLVLAVGISATGESLLICFFLDIVGHKAEGLM